MALYVVGKKNYHFHYSHDDTTANCAFKILHSNSKSINGTKITNNHLDKCQMDLQELNAMLCWGAISLFCLAVMHNQKKKNKTKSEKIMQGSLE